VKLPVCALQKAPLAKQPPLAFGQKCEVGRRQLIGGGYLGGGVGERAADGIFEWAGCCQEARPGDGRERYCDLKLGIIFAARALEGVGPTMIEHIFAARVALYVARRGANEGAFLVLGKQMARLPTRSSTDRS
jgi:hypothetical protein